jgi:mRNA interferase HigB
VHVITRKTLIDAAARDAALAASLDTWYRIAKQATWRNLAEVKRTWASADAVGACTVFNIKGNEFRLICWINYRSQRLFIRNVLRHAEYSKGGWKRDCFGS